MRKKLLLLPLLKCSVAKKQMQKQKGTKFLIKNSAEGKGGGVRGNYVPLKGI